MKWNAFRSDLATDAGEAVRLVGRLRWLMLALAAGLILACRALDIALPWLLVGQSLAILALANLALAARLRRGAAPLVVLRWGLLADVAALTELLAFSGGAANPLASLYLPPVLFAALLSPGRFAWLLAGLSIAAYGALFQWHLDWPLHGGDAAYAFNLHLAGMWGSFALSALLIAGFVSWMAGQLRRQGEALAAARETQLRDEQLLAVGMQAAGAAHALSTPLNTLTLLVDELLEDHGDGALAQDLRLMQAQLQSCRQTLARLKHGSEPDPGCAPLFATLAERLEGWRSLRPDVRLAWQAPEGRDPLVRLDPAFWPAFFNLINNAAEAGGGELAVSASLSGSDLRLDIVNRQGCLSPAQLARAGLAPLESAKPAGMGLGVMLSHATLARLGGTLSLDNRAQGGVHARVCLPLKLEGA
ncbi:ATP-binding protein [Xenophilus sp. AP218F]|nr:ATP-binding protein [Chromobacterium sp. ASV5]OWY37703.1 ATP-binding protein [Xenophilus sp. AP218F]